MGGLNELREEELQRAGAIHGDFLRSAGTHGDSRGLGSLGPWVFLAWSVLIRLFAIAKSVARRDRTLRKFNGLGGEVCALSAKPDMRCMGDSHRDVKRNTSLYLKTTIFMAIRQGLSLLPEAFPARNLNFLPSVRGA